jgi:hypothetical protein
MSSMRRLSVVGTKALGIGGLALLAGGCGSSVKKIEPAEGDARRQFRIECIEMDQCKQKANVACGSSYDVVSEWHNAIPESDLPGLNESTRPKDARDWNRHYLPSATGIESNDPMPLASIVVACKG